MKVALCQSNCGDDVAANEEQVFALLDEAAAGGPDLIALPEVWPCQGSAAHVRAAAEPVPGPRTYRLAEFAREHGVWVHGGSVLERNEERVYNTSVLFDRAGELVAPRTARSTCSTRIHPAAVPSRESFVFSPGDQVVTAESEFGRLGMSICYDVRFPELYRTLAVQGATILFVPAAFRYETGVDHWDVLLRARAIEDQAFVVAAAQWGPWGPPGKERRNFGHSLVADPWGRVVAEAPDGVGVTFAELDLAEVGRVREILPSLRHRTLGPVC